MKIFKTNAFSCRVCKFDNNDVNLLICSTDSCQACYHTFCLRPPLTSIPKWQWKCPECIRKICNRPMDLFGFPQSSKSYSLQEFGVKADLFKSQYFQQESSTVSCATVEKEFWRILQEYSEDVVVEYGADIHSSDQGSGFPTERHFEELKKLFPKSEQSDKAMAYARSPWNLNNLPVYGNSVLRFIKGNIDGMKVPWCYVGMVFSAFCWHIEDHWSYSINFMHWGEPKTWYGVSSLHATDFENAMKKHAEELFAVSPDLLHHITTTMNPNVLESEGVPIYRTDQNCGEFVITFPRAYHAGFNQGFNFAEAVNICNPEWLPMGRACVEHYASVKRQCVFSNDELMLTLAEVATGCSNVKDAAIWSDLTAECFRKVFYTGFDINALRIIHSEFSIITDREIKLQNKISKSVKNTQCVRLDELPDDERVCNVCQTTLFFSALVCQCNQNNESILNSKECLKRKYASEDDIQNESAICSKMVCLNHAEDVCNECTLSDCTMKYTCTPDHLQTIKAKLLAKLTSYDLWRNNFSLLLDRFDFSLTFSDSTNEVLKEECKKETKVHQQISMPEFELKLEEARKLGYYTDTLFLKAENHLSSLKHLLEACDKTSDLILDKLQLDQENVDIAHPANTVSFHLLRPSTLHVSPKSLHGVDKKFISLHCELDLQNPREVDLIRLSEAISQQEGPICLNNIPSVILLRKLVSRLQEWREKAKETLTKTKHILPQLTHLSATAQPVASLDIKMKPENDLDCLKQRVSELILDMKEHFPGWCKHMEDLKLVCLLDEVCGWLVSSVRFDPSNSYTCLNKSSVNEHQWTVNELRDHLTEGDHYIVKIASVDASSTLGINDCKASNAANTHLVSNRLLRSSNITPEHKPMQLPPPIQRLTAVSIVPSMHPLIRQVRAKLHTSVGQLSQLLVNVDSLVLLISESIQTNHLHVSSSLSKLDTCITELKRLGVYGLGIPIGDDTFFVSDDLPDISMKWPRTTDAVKGICCNPELYKNISDVVSDCCSDESKLLFWWSAHMSAILSHGHQVCPSRPTAWLQDISTLKSVEQLVLGSKISNSSKISECQLSFKTYLEDIFGSITKLADDLLMEEDKCQKINQLPIDLYNSILMIALPSSTNAHTIELLSRIHSSVLTRKFDEIDTILFEASSAQNSKLSLILQNAHVNNCCSKCLRKLHFNKQVDSEIKLENECLLCTILSSKPRTSVTLYELVIINKQKLELSDTLCLNSDLTNDLERGVQACISNLAVRCNNFLTEVVQLMEDNKSIFADFLRANPHNCQLCKDLLPELLITLQKVQRLAFSTKRLAKPDTRKNHQSVVFQLRRLIASSCLLHVSIPFWLSNLLEGTLENVTDNLP